MGHLQYRHAESDHQQVFCLYSRPPGPEPQWQHEAWLRDVSARTVLRHPEPRRTQDRSIPGASALQSFPNYRGRPPPRPPRLTFISQGSATANDRFINSKNTPVNIQSGKKVLNNTAEVVNLFYQSFASTGPLLVEQMERNISLWRW